LVSWLVGACRDFPATLLATALQPVIREEIMISRRDLVICAALTLARPAAAQQGPRLFVLPKGVTGAIQSATINIATRRDLEGWLVCNGASAYRTAYPELYSSMGPNAGLGESASTFLLPDLDVEYRDDGQPVRGTAICPFSSFGTPVGVMMPFDRSGNSW
jgi:Phage Tail Collar Domain